MDKSFFLDIFNQILKYGEKEIKIISVPKQIGQAQVVKQTIQELIKNNIQLDIK